MIAYYLPYLFISCILTIIIMIFKFSIFETLVPNIIENIYHNQQHNILTMLCKTELCECYVSTLITVKYVKYSIDKELIFAWHNLSCL
jgi:hypothetical protein